MSFFSHFHVNTSKPLLSELSLKKYIVLLRPYQYLKNLSIFLPIFFGLKVTQVHLLIKTGIAFIAVCFISSAVYIFNDISDIEEDKKHPIKKFRPLAAGTISRIKAVSIMCILLIIGLSISFFLNIQMFYLTICYLVLNVLYSIILKHQSIIDIFVISLGFIIRIFIGGVVAKVVLSHWIILITFLLALFLALAKRRDDFIIYLKNGEKMRKSIDGYNLEFIDASLVIMTVIVVVCYIMYTISPDVILRSGSNNLYITVFFVILGLMRYLQITIVEHLSGSPTEVLLKDRFIQLVLFGWLMTFSILIYL